LAAFLLPLFVFILCLVVLDKVLAGIVPSEPVRIVSGAMGSGLAAFAAALLAGRLYRHRDRHLKEMHDRDQG
jgi:hypothetical protein